MLMTTDLIPGQKARLISFGQADVVYRQKLLAFGVTCGVVVKVIHVAPLGCPILFEVRGAALALRKDEASHLQWELV